MGTSYIKPGIDRTNVSGPMFTHYNIVPIYGEEEVDDEVDATPDADENKGNKGSGIIDETEEGTGETIIEPPKIENQEGSGDSGGPGSSGNQSGNSTGNNPNDNGTIDNNTTGENEEAVTPGGVTIE